MVVVRVEIEVNFCPVFPLAGLGWDSWCPRSLELRCSRMGRPKGLPMSSVVRDGRAGLYRGCLYYRIMVVSRAVGRTR